MKARRNRAKKPEKPKPPVKRHTPNKTTKDIASEDSSLFPVVAIGASAGGLAAFEAFFSGMPEKVDTGMAFVLVQHLAPDHKSILAELVNRYTRMSVFEVTDGMAVEPDCAYIIPPNRDMAFHQGTLQLLEPAEPRGHRFPIDFFFRSLSKDRMDKAIGIVLSGTGTDGTLGVRAIKGAGGMVMAQTPSSTEYAGMPLSAINTGLLDYELPPGDMPRALMNYVKQTKNKTFQKAADSPVAEDTLKKIFMLLRLQTGHDFSGYKPSTISRRISRRMAVHQMDTIEAYLEYLHKNKSEVEILFRELLIGVTNFFRDPEAFKALEEKVIPKIFDDKAPGATVRVWITGCSTGEEAYSIAMLFREHMEISRNNVGVQIFATDIDSQAIAVARGGVYPDSISFDVVEERLESFFTHEPDMQAYRIHKSIRDMMIFSEQDIIKDPPFSKLDLICCRNLLIYLGGPLQKKILPLFHYALNPEGFLFLGTSETVGEHGALFADVDRKAKIYRRMEPSARAHRPFKGSCFPPLSPQGEGARRKMETAGFTKNVSLAKMTEEILLEQVVPSAALVNQSGDILYFHGRTGKYLEPAPGESGLNNILKMAREGLRQELTLAIRKAAMDNAVVHRGGLRVRTNGDTITVNLTVHPVGAERAAKVNEILFLVTLEEAVFNNDIPKKVPTAGPVPGENFTEMEALRQELKNKNEYLQTTTEELESTNEELRSSNEEMQSVNEELQSTNEELETSKEELQTVNEELATVNAELQSKVEDLSRANNDMNNLLAGTGIGTIFVDHDMQILRFTPNVTRIINLIKSDVGRPVGHIVYNLMAYDSLLTDVQSVLDTLIPKEVEVSAADGMVYLMRIIPYRTLDNVIEGAVINFFDITERKKLERGLQKALDEIKTLRGIIPICSNCKKIRDDHGAWTQIESYIRDHSDADFTHGLCSECMIKLYPEMADEDEMAGGSPETNET